MLKILFILPTISEKYGGPVFVVKKYMEKLKRKGIKTDVFPNSEKYKDLNIFPPLGIKLTYFPGMNKLLYLRKIISSYDLIHIHGLWSTPTTFGAFICRRLKKTYIITPHGMLDEWSLKQNKRGKKIQSILLEKKNLNSASMLHFFNNEEYSQAKKFGIKAPVFILPNGIEIKDFENIPSKKELVKKYSFLKNKTVLLFLGRIHYKKGFDILIPAFSEALKVNKNLFLIIAGPDEGYKNKVVDLIHKYSLKNYIHFTGFVKGEEKKMLLGGSDIFILPSYQEGDSIAIKEAMASGLPVIISPYCHLNEIEKYNAGIICDLKISDLSESIIKLSKDGYLRKEIGENAKKFVFSNYNWDIIVNKMLEKYKSIVSLKYSRS